MPSQIGPFCRFKIHFFDFLFSGHYKETFKKKITKNFPQKIEKKKSSLEYLNIANYWNWPFRNIIHKQENIYCYANYWSVVGFRHNHINILLFLKENNKRTLPLIGVDDDAVILEAYAYPVWEGCNKFKIGSTRWLRKGERLNIPKAENYFINYFISASLRLNDT